MWHAVHHTWKICVLMLVNVGCSGDGEGVGAGEGAGAGAGDGAGAGEGTGEGWVDGPELPPQATLTAALMTQRR